MLQTLLFVTLALAPQQKVQLGQLLADATKSTGIYVVAVPLLAQEQVTKPSEPLTAQTLEPYLKQLVAQIKIPASIVKLNLPPPPKGRPWSADELIAYASAEAQLYRKQVGEPRSDIVEILAQPLTPEKARPAVEALDLKPVYVLMLKQGYFGGTWQTTYGEMHLTQSGNKVTGTYTTGNGTISGQIVGNELRFQWFEQSSSSGGYGAFRLSNDAMSFAGPWYNDSNPDAPAGTSDRPAASQELVPTTEPQLPPTVKT